MWRAPVQALFLLLGAAILLVIRVQMSVSRVHGVFMRKMVIFLAILFGLGNIQGAALDCYGIALGLVAGSTAAAVAGKNGDESPESIQAMLIALGPIFFALKAAQQANSLSASEAASNAMVSYCVGAGIGGCAQLAYPWCGLAAFMAGIGIIAKNGYWG
jgi:hypothetical protein